MAGGGKIIVRFCGGRAFNKQMRVMDDLTLLRDYASTGSEMAFATLVSRYAPMVHSAGLRQTRDPYLAGEVTQAVFIILAQKSGRMSKDTILTGWLYKTTRFVALAQTRAAVRRRQYEQEFQMPSEDQPNPPEAPWEQIAPLLDEALTKLGEKDRQALLWRYFEDKAWLKLAVHWGRAKTPSAYASTARWASCGNFS